MSAIYLVDLPIAASTEQPWDQVIAIVEKWIDERVGLTVVPDGTANSPDGATRVEHQHRQAEAGRLHRWDARQARDGWGWHTTLWLLDDGGGPVTLRVRLQVEVTGAHTTELDRPLSRPRIVADVLDQLTVTVDGFRLGRPLRLDREDVPALAAYLLDPQRTRPVVVVTSRPGAPHGPGPAQTMADRLGGLAHVVDLDDADSTRALGAALGVELTVFDGAVRLYWPGFTLRDRRSAHPLYLRRDIERVGRQAVESQVFRRVAAASVLVADVPLLDRLLREEEAAAERARTDVRLAELRRQLDQQQQAPRDGQTLVGPEWFAHLEEALAAADTMRRERDEALFDVELLREEVDQLEDALDVERQNWQLLQQTAEERTDEAVGSDIPGEGEADHQPATVAEAVRIAAAECTNLVFLDEAHRTAEDSYFPRPQKVLSDLRALDRVVARWRADEESLTLRQLCAEEGLSNVRPGVSSTALNRYEADYARTYKGQKVHLRSHLASGVGAPSEILRIYWYEDTDDRTLVVGHVGRKLRDRSNR